MNLYFKNKNTEYKIENFYGKTGFLKKIIEETTNNSIMEYYIPIQNNFFHKKVMDNILLKIFFLKLTTKETLNETDIKEILQEYKRNKNSLEKILSIDTLNEYKNLILFLDNHNETFKLTPFLTKKINL